MSRKEKRQMIEVARLQIITALVNLIAALVTMLTRMMDK